MVDAQVAEHVALRHRHVKTQDLQDVVDRQRLVLVQLHRGSEVKQRGRGRTEFSNVGFIASGTCFVKSNQETALRD